jgi:hypothetical protein
LKAEEKDFYATLTIFENGICIDKAVLGRVPKLKIGVVSCRPK